MKMTTSKIGSPIAPKTSCSQVEVSLTWTAPLGHQNGKGNSLERELMNNRTPRIPYISIGVNVMQMRVTWWYSTQSLAFMA
jgi:hypothetical protein